MTRYRRADARPRVAPGGQRARGIGVRHADPRVRCPRDPRSCGLGQARCDARELAADDRADAPRHLAAVRSGRRESAQILDDVDAGAPAGESEEERTRRRITRAVRARGRVQRGRRARQGGRRDRSRARRGSGERARAEDDPPQPRHDHAGVPGLPRRPRSPARARPATARARAGADQPARGVLAVSHRRHAHDRRDPRCLRHAADRGVSPPVPAVPARHPRCKFARMSGHGTPKVVLAYSGGLDTWSPFAGSRRPTAARSSASAPTSGRTRISRPRGRRRSRSARSKAVVRDLRDEFVRDYVLPALRAGALYEGQYLLGTSLARPCIARRMMECRRGRGADAIAHGATGKGNDQVRFELAAYHFRPGIKIIAPWREWEFKGRRELIEYTKQHSIPIEATADKPYSVDRNLLHTSYEGGVLEDPWREPDTAMFQRTRDPRAGARRAARRRDRVRGRRPGRDRRRAARARRAARPAQPDRRRARRRARRPRREPLRRHEVARRLRDARRHVLHARAPAVESLTLDREVLRLRQDLMPRYAALVYNGFWFSPEREALQRHDRRHRAGDHRHGAAQASTRARSRCSGARRRSCLYRPDIVTFEEDTVYDQRDAQGFIRLNALRLRIRSELDSYDACASRGSRTRAARAADARRAAAHRGRARSRARDRPAGGRRRDRRRAGLRRRARPIRRVAPPLLDRADAQGFAIADLGSKNGTCIDGVAVGKVVAPPGARSRSASAGPALARRRGRRHPAVAHDHFGALSAARSRCARCSRSSSARRSRRAGAVPRRERHRQGAHGARRPRRIAAQGRPVRRVRLRRGRPRR